MKRQKHIQFGFWRWGDEKISVNKAIIHSTKHILITRLIPKIPYNNYKNHIFS